MGSPHTVIETKLKVKASFGLAKEVEEELKQKDPSEDKAKAVLRGESNETRS